LLGEEDVILWKGYTEMNVFTQLNAMEQILVVDRLKEINKKLNDKNISEFVKGFMRRVREVVKAEIVNSEKERKLFDIALRNGLQKKKKKSGKDEDKLKKSDEGSDDDDDDDDENKKREHKKKEKKERRYEEAEEEDDFSPLRSGRGGRGWGGRGWGGGDRGSGHGRGGFCRGDGDGGMLRLTAPTSAISNSFAFANKVYEAKAAPPLEPRFRQVGMKN
jgi:hypothetical protein